MAPRPEKVLCLLSRVLGGTTFSAAVVEAMKGLPGYHPRYVYLHGQDYQRYWKSVPLWNRKAGLFVGSHIMRLKLREDDPPPCDAVIMQSFELLPMCADLPASLPIVLAHDATNVLSYRLIRDQRPGPRAALMCRLKELLVTPAYRRVLPRVRAFLPRTRWCAQSLVRDFGVDPRRIAVIPSGLDVASWTPAPEPRSAALPVILFVGNDFARKGGPFLLEVFRRHLQGRARLRIVSNDPALPSLALPEGAEAVTGLQASDREGLLAVYRAADIFAFPSTKDHMGQALVEAAAAGLPIVARDVGGVGEIVRDGENGRLLPYAASGEDWAGVLLDLIADGGKRARYGSRGREMAEKEFSLAALRERLDWALATATA